MGTAAPRRAHVPAEVTRLMGQPAATAYELWVRTIRAWSGDESVSLVGLPQLSEDSMPAGAYSRLIDHVAEAIETVTARWDRSLARTLESIGEPSALAMELVSLRRRLARRLELARHPSLPEVVRTAFSEAADRDIRSYQRDLEDAVSKLGRSGHVPTTVVDALYRCIRENSFVAVLNYTGAAPGGRFTPDHRPADALADNQPTTSSRRVRRIIP